MVGDGKLFDPSSNAPLVHITEIRNACKCNLCVNPSDRQRNYHWAEIPPDIAVESFDIDENGTYTVRWKNDVPGFENHVSQYTKEDVMEAAFFQRRHGHTVHQRPIRLWDGSSYDLNSCTLPYDDFMEQDKTLSRALHILHQSGLVFVNQIPKDDMNVGRLAERLGTLRNTFYGLMWDVKSVPGAKNVAYTSRNLGFHMDLLYMQEPPGLQLLHCLENTCEGGLSRFVDTFKALDVLISQKGPDILETLTKTFVPYEYSNDRMYFYDRKPIVSYDAFPKQLRFVHQANNSRLLSKVRRVYWSPPFTAPHMSTFTQWSESRMRAAKAFADVLEAPGMDVTVKLPPGTCAIFDNLRIVHARTAFDTSAGHRWLRGAYVDHQDFYSKAVELEEYKPMTRRKLSLKFGARGHDGR
jgi:gamma-butyrobetaine dioxygenase